MPQDLIGEMPQLHFVGTTSFLIAFFPTLQLIILITITKIKFGNTAENSFDWDANIVNYSLKSDISYYLNPKNLLTFGGQAIIYEFSPGNAVGVSEGQTSNFSVPKKYALEAGLFLENDQTINDKISLRYGLRWSHFNYMGEGRAFEFADAEPGERRLPSGPAQNFQPVGKYSNVFQFGTKGFSKISG